MLRKNHSHEVKDLDKESGVVVAYANMYGNEDSDGDISMPGSFTETVKNQSEKIRVFKDHNRFQMLGVPIEIDTSDNKGLLTKTQFNLEKQLSRDMFTDIRLMTEHGQDADMSVGVIDKRRDNDDNRKVLQWELKEYSFLSSWGANSAATVQSLKSDGKMGTMIDLLQKAYDLDYSDQRLKQIETILLSLEGNDTSTKEQQTEITLNDILNNTKNI